MDMQNLWQIFKKKKKIPPRSQANSLELESMLDVF